MKRHAPVRGGLTVTRQPLPSFAVAALVAVLAGCTHAAPRPSRPDTGSQHVVAARTPHHVGRATLHGAELRYGASARLDPGVVYQPDVVPIGGGANAVRSVSADGLVWSMDATAPA